MPYSEGTINMMYGLKKYDDQYQEILEKVDDMEFEVYMKSLCNSNTAWVESCGEKIVKMMNLKPESKDRYLFIKHSLNPTTHNEIVNKTRSTLLHCIIGGYDINVGKIIAQEIQTCSKKKEGMLYFLFLIIALCTKHGVQDKEIDEARN